MMPRVLWVAAFLAAPLAADEGLWLFNLFPKDQVKQKYNFDATDEFIDHIRLSFVQIGSASGAFVSNHGLMLTSRRAISDCADKLHDGFAAVAETDEAKCPGLSADALLRIEDVTKQVKDAASEKMKPAEALERRRTSAARVEQSCEKSTGNRCSVIKLYSGERYDLYQYKRYADVRLVLAPERAIASFGGSPAALTYPRYAMDFAFVRAYENNRPAETPRFLKWSDDGVTNGALSFAPGIPASTARVSTAAQITFYRDSALPFAVSRLQSRIQALVGLAGKDANHIQAIKTALADLGAEYKLTAGKLIGLKDEWLLMRTQSFEKKLRNAVEKDPQLGAQGGKVWDEVAAAYKTWTPFERSYQVLEKPGAEGSALFRIARAIVRGEPVNGAEPIDDVVEVQMLTRYFEELRTLGEKEAPLKVVLGGKTPEQAAEEYVDGSKLRDPLERKGASDSDSMIRLAKLLEEPARKIAKRHADTVETVEISSAERIAQYRYRVFGPADYPEATGTPRLTYGVVKEYRDRTEALAPYATTFGGLFHLAANQEPFLLPANWSAAKAALGLVTPMNFATTCDIASGASGAPVINQKGEITGVTFDGNLESIATLYSYDDDKARAVHVAVQGIAEAVEKIYKMPRLLRELGVKTPALSSTIQP